MNFLQGQWCCLQIKAVLFLPFTSGFVLLIFLLIEQRLWSWTSLFCPWSLEDFFQSFTMKWDVCCGLCWDAFCQFLSGPSGAESSCQESMLGFVESFLCSCWIDLMVFIFSLLIWWTSLIGFSNAKSTLRSWNKSPLVMKYYIFDFPQFCLEFLHQHLWRLSICFLFSIRVVILTS